MPHIPGQEMTSPRCDVAMSFSINFIRGYMACQNSKTEMLPDSVRSGYGKRGSDWALLAYIRESFKYRDCSWADDQFSPAGVTYLVSSEETPSGTGRAAQA